MKVYILMGYYNNTDGIRTVVFGIFSTKEKAQEIINIWEKYEPNYMDEGFEIEEIELDEPLDLPPMYEIEMMRRN